MGLRNFKPTTPSLRHTVLLRSEDITRKGPEKRLIETLRYKAARNKGRITVRHRGGRVKRLYRKIDFKRDKRDIVSFVEAIEYDPNRTANIAILKYKDGDKRYILAPNGLKVGMEIMSGDNVPLKAGNATKLKSITSGIKVHNIEMLKGSGGKLCRSAGSFAIVMGGDKGYIQLRMPSGEIRLINGECYATIGEVGNLDCSNIKFGKAGRKRYLGIRPTVRGKVMGANDHPHGGGEAKHKVGGQRKTIYGKRTDVKTRKNKRTSRFIIKRKTTRRRPFAKIR